MLRFWLRSGPAQNLVAMVGVGILLAADALGVDRSDVGGLSPLGSLIAGVLPGAWCAAVGYVLLGLSAFLVWRQYIEHAHAERVVLPLLLSLYWGLLVPQPRGRMMVIALALVFVAFTVRIMLREEDSAQQASMAHRAGAMLGLATLLYAPVWPFVVLPLVVLFYRSALSIRRVVLLLLGFSVPFLGVIMGSYLLDRPWNAYIPDAAAVFPLPYGHRFGDMLLQHWPALGIWLLALALWLGRFAYDRKPHGSRINAYLLARGVLRTWVVLACCATLLAPHPEGGQMLLAIPLGLVMTRLFSSWEDARVGRWLFLLLMLATLAVVLASRFPAWLPYPALSLA